MPKTTFAEFEKTRVEVTAQVMGEWLSRCKTFLELREMLLKDLEPYLKNQEEFCNLDASRPSNRGRFE